LKDKYTGKCLGVKNDFNETEGLFPNLTWRFCTPKDKWIAIPLDDNFTRIAQPGSDLCLSATQAASQDSFLYLSVKPCSKSGNTSLQFKYSGRPHEEGKLCDVKLITPEKQVVNEWSDKGFENKYPSVFRFHVVKVNPSVAPCSRFHVKNGMILDEDTFSNVSIYIPGETINVICYQGFGIKQLSYASKLKLVCGDGTWNGSVLRCKKKPKSKIQQRDSNNALDKFTLKDCLIVTAVGALLIAGVVIFLAMLHQRGKGNES
jgi:hypothetical protein